MDSSSEDLFCEDLRKAADAKNAACEKLCIGEISDGKSEKENENGKESFKSPSKSRQILALLDETEKELQYRQKYAKSKEEVVKDRMLRCTVCSCSLQSALLKGRSLFHHPVLKVLLCKQCFDFYGDGNFSSDEDGSDKYCRWCGQGGMLYCCSSCSCAFCKNCIKRNLGRSVLVDIEADDWKCFVCIVQPLWALRALCANAQLYSEKIKRNKQSENENKPQQMALKENNPQQTSLQSKKRQLYHKSKDPLFNSSSSDDASSGNKEELYRNRCKRNGANAVALDGRRKNSKKQNTKSCDSVMEIEVPTSGKNIECVQLSDSGTNEKKIKNGPLTDDSTSPVCFEGSSNSEEVSTDNSRNKKCKGGKYKVRRTQTVTEGSWFSRDAVKTDKGSKSESNQEHSSGGRKELPQELDDESAKLACQFLEKSCRELIDVGEVLVLRAKRCLEKKVSLKTMTNPQNIDKVVNSLQLLTKLAGDNLQHVEGFLSLSHTHWVRGVVKRRTKTGGDVGNEDKRKKIVTKLGRVDGNMSLNGAGNDDVEFHSLSEKDSDNGKIENKETAEGQSDILCGDSDHIKEMRMDKSKKRKFKKEWSDSDDSEVVNTGENEGNAHESMMRSKKRRKMEDGLEIEIDEVVDPDISNTVTEKNCKWDSENMTKGSSNQTVTELRDGESGEEGVKDICTDATEYGGDSEVKKVTDRNKNLSDGSEEREEGNVTEKCVEDTSLLHENCDGLTQLKTYPDDDSTVCSQAGLESLSTLKCVCDEQNSQKSIVSDILIDPEKSVVLVEEALQQNSYEKSDEEQDYERLNAESDGKHTHPVMTDSELSAVDEDSKNDDSGDVAVIGGGSKNNDSDTLAVVDEGSKVDNSGILTSVGEGSKSDNSSILTSVGEGSKSDDSDALIAVIGGSKDDDNDALAAVDEGSKDGYIDALTAVSEGSKGHNNDALTAVGEGSRSDDSDAVGEGCKVDDSDALIAVCEDSKGDDSDALSEVGEGSKGGDSDALSEVGEGSKGHDGDTLTAVGEGSRGGDSDALSEVGEGSKGGDSDALSEVGEGSKGGDSDALSEVGEGSKGGDSDALSEVGEGSKGHDGDTLTAVGEGSKGGDSDALSEVGEGSKGGDGGALTAVGEGSKVGDSDALSEVGEGSKGDDSDALTTVGEDINNEKDKNNSSDAETIECLFTDADEKSLNDEDHDNKNEKLTSADNLKAVKSVPEENEDGEVKINEDMPVSLEEPDNVKKDSVTTGHPIIAVRNIKELLMEKFITHCNENNGEKNEINTCEDLEDTGKKDEVKWRLENDDKQGSSDMDKLKLSDNVSECEQEEKDDEEDMLKTDDNTAADSTNEEGPADAVQYTAECVKAQQSVLAYSTDNEETSSDTLPEKKKRKKRSRKTKQEVAALKSTKPAKKRRIGPKSQSHEGSDTVSSSVSTDIDSDCCTASKLTKPKEGRKQKFRLRDTEAYKQDEKLQWKCTVLVERLSDEVFQKHYEGYWTDGEDGSEKKSKANNEIHSLVNLKSLKKRRGNKYDTDDSDTEDSSDVGKNKSRKVTKKDKNKEQEQKLINFFNQMDDDDDSMSAGTVDSEEEAMKTLRKKKSFLERESEIVMQALLASSSNDTDSDSSKEEENNKENIKKKIKPKEEPDGTEQNGTEDVTKEEEVKEQEIKEEKADSCPSDGDVSSEDSEVLKRKRKWRRDKLLTARLSDLDTSDEERRWKTKKEKEKKANDDDSDEKSTCEMMPRKKKVRRKILGSDEDSEAIISSSEDNSSDDFVNKLKKPAKKSNSGRDSTSDTDTGRKKVKRRRIKAPADDSSSTEGGQLECSGKSDTPGKGRKNIHRIMKDADVGEATRRAAREEEERRKRISDKQKLYNEIYKEVEGVEVCDKLILDFDPETKEELVAVDPYIVSKLKPHQVKGMKFMWDACFESLKHLKKTKGSGCILAHCMGLGKTLQVVALVHTLLNHKETNVHTILIVCPLSTVLNWVNEFNIWLKDIANGEEVNVFELSKYKQNYERMYQLKEWQSCGGVMVMGYDMFRNLTNPNAARIRKKAMETFQSTLIDPGPDLVVCDEGHMLKNEDTALSKAMNRITTLRRIVLTGTPLQNNLKEYHCMVQFVKPNLLGTRKEFQNRFMNPISNGQFEDSTAYDVKIMKRRAHVLHKMLEGSVQRFDYSVLTPFLPPKHEYVISIRLCEVQIKAYRYYLENCAMGKSGVNSKGAQLFSDYQHLSRIWTHPRVLQMSTETAEKNAEKKRLMESDSEGSLRDFIDDGDADDTESTASSSGRSSSDESDVQVIAEGGEKKSKSTSRSTRSTRSKGPVEEQEVISADEAEKSKPLAWWKQFIVGDELEDMNYSGKLVLLFSILRECEKIGDKVLVFSQSLYSLDLIEYFLACVDSATQASETKESLDNNTGSWSVGLDYFRLDGSTSAENRSIWCRAFNREDNHRARLFIISTRAGGLGINLFAANRVIVFDASWNPSHDVQSIFRVYRFGQKKPCYIYRFLAQGTMEEKIYDRQVTKLSLSCRVVDEQQIERHYNMADLQELYNFNPEEKTKRPTPILPKDRLLAELLKEHEQWIVTYHEHDSLLENKEEEELNEEERKAAWEDYENEKKGKTLPAPGVMFNAPRALNLVALRETLRKENPHATEEELDLRLSMVVNQIYDYMNSSKNGMPSSNLQYTPTPAHVQAMRQYQMQHDQMLRAQQQEQQRMQQQNVMWPVPNSYPNSDISFRQYLQNQNQTNLIPGVYPTNLYRNVAADRPNVLRMQQKLVPFNPPPSSSRNVLQNVGGNVGGPEGIRQLPVTLPRPPGMTQSPFAPSSSRVNQRPEVLQQFDAQQLRGNTTSVPQDVIETID